MSWKTALQALVDRYELREIAERLDVRVPTVWRWQNGKRVPRKPFQRALIAWAEETVEQRNKRNRREAEAK